MQVFEVCLKQLNLIKGQLHPKLKGNANITIQSCTPDEEEKQEYYYGQIIKYAQKHDYYFNRNFPKSWLTFRVELAENKRYQLCISVHHYGYDDSTLSIGAFLEFLTPHESDEERIDEALPLEIKPYVISITGDVSSKEKNIARFVQDAATLTMAEIASDL